MTQGLLHFRALPGTSRLWRPLWRFVAGKFSEEAPMGGNSQSFRVGRVQVYRRGQVWYLCYHEDGQRRRPRVGPDKAAARQLAHEINSQLEAEIRDVV